MAAKMYHVFPMEDLWAVERDGAEIALSVHDSQSLAIETGRKLAKGEGAVLLIHGLEGRIELPILRGASQ